MPAMKGIKAEAIHCDSGTSTTIGVTDADREKPLLDELDRIAEALTAEKAKGAAADRTRLAALRKQFADVEAQAARYVVPAELATLYQRHGGIGINGDWRQLLLGIQLGPQFFNLLRKIFNLL